MPFILFNAVRQGRSIMTTQVIFIEVLNGSYSKVVTTSNRSAEQFCKDAAAYYKSCGIETEVKPSQKNKGFFGVFSTRNGKIMAVAGPEKNTFFWSKHTSIKKNVEEANGVPQKEKSSKYLLYAVISVEFTGFVRSWDECKEYTHGKSAKFKGFNSIEAAKTWMRENNAPSITFERYKEVKDIK